MVQGCNLITWKTEKKKLSSRPAWAISKILFKGRGKKERERKKEGRKKKGRMEGRKKERSFFEGRVEYSSETKTILPPFPGQADALFLS